MPRCNKHGMYYPDQMDMCGFCLAEAEAKSQEQEREVAVIEPADLRHNETLAAIILSGIAANPTVGIRPDAEYLADLVCMAIAAGAIVSERYALEVAKLDG